MNYDSFVLQLLETARNNKKKYEDGPDYLPMQPEFDLIEKYCSNPSLPDRSELEIKLGERLIASSGGCDHLLMDFYIESKDPVAEAEYPFAPKGLQLIEESYGKLVFEAVDVVDGRILTVTAINKETLLCNSNSILFRVVKK